MRWMMTLLLLSLVQIKPVQAEPVQAKAVQAKAVQAKTVQAKAVQAETVRAKTDRAKADRAKTRALSEGDGPNAGGQFEVLTREALPLGQRILMRSPILGETVSMNLYLPESFDVSSGDHTYPVIFTNGSHGEHFFEALVGIVKHLGDRERMPESIVVSLNDMGPIPEIFSHGMWPREKIGPFKIGLHGDPQAGVRHLAEEVIPWLESHFRANDYRILIGVSGSTLFPIFTFTEAPDLFRSHVLIAAADTIGMGYGPDSTFIDSFEKSLQQEPGRRALLYLGVADSDVTKREDYRKNLKELKARLGGFEGLDLEIDVFDRADHYAVYLRAMLAAFDQNFPFERWSARYRDLVAQPGDALANIDAYYRQLSEDYGFEILPRADRWNNVNCLRFMIRHLIREERLEEALAVARRRVEYRPRSAASYSGLADALEAAGRLEAAVAAQARALRLARAGEPSRLVWTEERLLELQAAESQAAELQAAKSQAAKPQAR